MISETAIKEFKELYLAEFGEKISDEQAVELGTNLLSLFNKIYRPLKKSWLEAVSEKEKLNKT